MRNRIDTLLKNLPHESNDLRLGDLKSKILDEVSTRSFRRRPTFFAIGTIGLVGVLMLGAAGTVYAAQSANPGTLLYPVKRGTEVVWVATQLSPEGKFEVEQRLLMRRALEATTIGATPKAAAIAAREYRKNLDAATSRITSERGDEDQRLEQAQYMDAFIDAQARDMDELIPANDSALDEMDDAYLDNVMRLDDMITQAQERELLGTTH